MRASNAREAEARRAVAADALDAATSISDLRQFLRERALPRAGELDEEAKALRTELERLHALGADVPRTDAPEVLRERALPRAGEPDGEAKALRAELERLHAALGADVPRTDGDAPEVDLT